MLEIGHFGHDGLVLATQALEMFAHGVLVAGEIFDLTLEDVELGVGWFGWCDWR